MKKKKKKIKGLKKEAKDYGKWLKESYKREDDTSLERSKLTMRVRHLEEYIKYYSN